MKDYLKTMGAVVRNERLQQNWSGAFATNAFSRTGPEPNSQNVPALG